MNSRRSAACAAKTVFRCSWTGARLAYALSCSCNELSLKDIARLCDVFYIGGTKCGALFGEAVVITQQNLIPILTVIKQNGALLAKGRMLGIQFDTLF